MTLWPSLTGGEIIDLLGRLRGGINASRRKALTERFDLDTSKRARAYSRGNRQKVALLAALASGAELLLPCTRHPRYCGCGPKRRGTWPSPS